jgi:hypothetical protein
MLFVALAKVRAGTQAERIQRRITYRFPEGFRIEGEYWLPTPDPKVVLIFESDDALAVHAALSAWDDVFDISVFPAVRAEEGLQAGKRLMGLPE